VALSLLAQRFRPLFFREYGWIPMAIGVLGLLHLLTGGRSQPKHIQASILRVVPEYVEARLHERSRFLMPWGDGI